MISTHAEIIVRAHQISPENAKSVERPLRLIAVPIRCRCTVPVRNDRCQSNDKLAVKVNGLLIENATIRVRWYHIEDGPSVDVEFSGTIAVFARTEMGTVEAARLSQIEFVGGSVVGRAYDLHIDVMPPKWS